MVKFSASGYDDGEGSSNPNQKRRRVEEDNQSNQQQPQQQSQEGFEMEYAPLGNQDQQQQSNHRNGERETVGSSSSERGKNISAIISDPDVLDCFICCEPLSVPVFQCQNGHIACSCCCAKVRNKCPLCRMLIGYFRCRPMEKLLESIKISCPNAKYGCEEVVSYCMKGHHEKECRYIPCLCPHTDCDFVASSKELALHFIHRHVGSGVQFTYDKFFSVFLNADQKTFVLRDEVFLNADQKTFVLRDEKDVGLFVVHNKIVSLGNAITISCLGPTSMVGFHYDVIARSQGSTLILQSSTKMIQGDDTTVAPTIAFLLIPSNYFASGQFKLDIRIKSR